LAYVFKYSALSARLGKKIRNPLFSSISSEKHFDLLGWRRHEADYSIANKEHRRQKTGCEIRDIERVSSLFF